MTRLLTDRQADALLLLCAGITPRRAAAVLGISPDAVRGYLAGARARLGLGTPLELGARAPDDLAAAEQRAHRRRSETAPGRSGRPEMTRSPD